MRAAVAKQPRAENFNLCGSRDEKVTFDRTGVLNYPFCRIAKYHVTRYLDR